MRSIDDESPRVAVAQDAPSQSLPDAARSAAPEPALLKGERSLLEREREYQKRSEALKADEQAFAQRTNKLTLAEAGWAKRQRESAVAEGQLEERARLVAQREIDADSGFASKNREAIGVLTKEHAALRAELQKGQSQLETERVQGIERLDIWLSEERRVRLATLDADLATLRQRVEKDTQDELQRERSRVSRERQEHDLAIAAERNHVASEQRTFREDAERQRTALLQKEGELQVERSKVQWRSDEIEARKSEIERGAQERAQDSISSLERHRDAVREDLQRLREVRITLEAKLASHDELFARFGGSPEEVLRRLDDAAIKNAALEKELLARPSASDRDRLVSLLEQQRGWEEERDRMLVELNKLRAERGRWLLGVQELEAQREQQEVAKRRLEVLKGEMDKYASDVDRMRSLYERPEERDKRVEGIEEPWLIDFKRAPDDTNLTEIAWLDRIVASCEASDMRFPKRLVYAFHTSLKSAELSPLTVLAGVSGTGKSELPRLYSRFGGLAFLSLAVQPNWDSPQSLFGFFNSVDNRFSATTVLRAMVQAQHAPNDEKYKNGLSDRLLLVLLDEMNLAHVEQYFSDLLSRLEQRRGETRVVTHEIDLGAGMSPYALNLGRNVMWVGTMNEDETTKSLSDKVVDRSNLLYFPRPRTLHSRKELSRTVEAPLLPQTTWNRWLQVQSPFSTEELAPFKQALEDINGHLEHVGRALGHRVWQAVSYYMANHPETLDARGRGDLEALKRAMRRAFEDQLVLKVMPKLRGIETSGDSKRNCLDPIRKQLEETTLGLGLSEDFDIACRVGYGSFIWNSARYLENVE